MNNATDKVAKEAINETQKNMKSALDQFGKAIEELNNFAKGNLDAMNKTGEISAKVAENVSKEIVEVSKKNFDEGVKAAQTIVAAKNPNDLMEKQAAFAKSALETYTKQATALADLFTKSTAEVFAPMNERIKAAGEIVKRAQV